MNKKLRKRTFEILETAKEGDVISKIFDIFILILIFLNVIAVILETIEKISSQLGHFFNIFEVSSVIVFTIEYILRIWSCTTDVKFHDPVWGRVRFIFTPLALIDLMAILPFYLPMLIPLDLRFIRAVRLFRVFRLFKMGRYSDSLKTFGNVIKKKREELVISLFIVFVLLVTASSLMYFVENRAQPEAFPNIPAAMWWGITTLTTVGYGDVYPITPLGKLFGAIISLLGIGMFALPAGILVLVLLKKSKENDKK